MSASVPHFMTLEALRSVPLFASLDDEAARALRDLLEVQHAPAGTRLFRMGAAGDALYLIEGGRVRIHIHDADGDDVTLADLGDGDFFGEMALLDGKPRSAHATVTEDAHLGVLSRDDFLAFVRRNPDVALKMMSAMTERLRRTDELLRQRVSRNLNEEDEARLTMSDRLADSLAEFGGSWKFISLTLALLVVWVALNSWYLLGAGRFDEYPYQLLGLVLGVIAGIQAPIIMMSQNRQEEKDRLRADLDYKVNLKNELALAEVLRRLDVLESERLPLLFAEQSARLREQMAEGSKQ
jgi:CRP/FNR family cyclic AMP-dependent transcriptional regulator